MSGQSTTVREPGAWRAMPSARILTLIGHEIGVLLLFAGYVYV
jgi:hypothetical protein